LRIKVAVSITRYRLPPIIIPRQEAVVAALLLRYLLSYPVQLVVNWL
jgi:hypothetical protein